MHLNYFSESVDGVNKYVYSFVRLINWRVKVNIFEMHNLDWYDSLSKMWKVLVIAIPCLAICLWCKFKYTGKELNGFNIVDCDKRGMDIPTWVVLIFLIPPFGGVFYIFFLIIHPIVTILFSLLALLIICLWSILGEQ